MTTTETTETTETTSTFEEQWAAAQTSEARSELLRIHFPKSNRAIKYTCTVNLMECQLPATKSSQPNAELTFCNATIRTQVCGLEYCHEDLYTECAGMWFCEECSECAAAAAAADDDDEAEKNQTVEDVDYDDSDYDSDYE